MSDRHEKLQVTLTRSLSVQDGLDEMMTWMEKVEKNLGQSDPPALNSTAMREMLSKEAVRVGIGEQYMMGSQEFEKVYDIVTCSLNVQSLVMSSCFVVSPPTGGAVPYYPMCLSCCQAMDQDMSSRQSSISAMKSKVKKFIETAEPSAALALQAKMDTLSQRFTDACEKHKNRVNKLEELRDKVELFEKTSEKVQQFVTKRSLDLSETEGPGTNVNELSQMMEVGLWPFSPV